MIKIFSNETEWDIFNNVLQTGRVYAKSQKERKLLDEITKAIWTDNTSTRPDFISDDFMIEMFEIDDIVTSKKGKNNPQRKADARALRDVENWMSNYPEGTFREDLMIIAHGDTRYNPEADTFMPDDSVSHHNYGAYLNNFTRICNKHLASVEAYRKNYHNKKLGFLIVDDSTMYLSKLRVHGRDIFLSLPFFDKNFMKSFIKSDVDFVVWAFNNKYTYTEENSKAHAPLLPNVALINKDNYYNKYSKKFDVKSMISLEE